MSEAAAPARVSFAEALRVWARIGLLSFGGPAGQIALMHRVLVEERRWISETRFLHALNYCMLLPGPEAMQLATYVGWLLHRTAGGLAAGLLFVLPGFLVVLALSMVYAAFGDVPAVAALLIGIKAAVLAIVIEALIRIGRRVLTRAALYAIAAAAFAAIALFAVPFPLIVAGAGLLGLAAARLAPSLLPPPGEVVTGDAGASTVDAMMLRGELEHTRPSLRRSLRTLGVCLALWFAPLGLLAAGFGAGSMFVDLGLFFSQAAMVTFGGAYAVLAFVAQQVVEVHGWLTPVQMVDGLGLAETTPGPLILVLEFVGFTAAYQNPGDLPPMMAGVLGALITVWVTFVPCFLWIFMGAPWIERLRGSRPLHAALTAITAAVVGVILNLSLWFAVHVLWTDVGEREVGPLRILVPDWDTLSEPALALAAGSALALFWLRLGMIRTLLASAAAGALWWAI